MMGEFLDCLYVRNTKEHITKGKRNLEVGED